MALGPRAAEPMAGTRAILGTPGALPSLRDDQLVATAAPMPGEAT